MGSILLSARYIYPRAPALFFCEGPPSLSSVVGSLYLSSCWGFPPPPPNLWGRRGVFFLPPPPMGPPRFPLWWPPLRVFSPARCYLSSFSFSGAPIWLTPPPPPTRLWVVRQNPIPGRPPSLGLRVWQIPPRPKLWRPGNCPRLGPSLLSQRPIFRPLLGLPLAPNFVPPKRGPGPFF